MKKIILLVFTIVSSIIVNAQCDYTLRMIDSYGDGWTDNTIDVIVNGDTVLNDVTLASGNSEDLAITVNTGDEITTLWNGGGSWGGETSYQILDASGNEVGAGAETSIETAITVDCPSCNIVTAINASNISNSGGDLSWTAGGTESAWNIEYGASGFALGSGSSATSSNPNYSISGLNVGTLCDVYVQADCGGGETSDWAGPYSFSTLGSCGEYILEYVNVSWGTENSYTVTNQDGVVLANEGYNAGTGAPNSVSFQTNIGDVLTLTLSDSYGDGWGDNVINITSNGDAIGTFTLASGSGPESFTIIPCASCPDISLAALTVNVESAVASWNPQDEFTSYTLEIGDTGFVLGTGTTYTTSDTSYTFTGLTENTFYSFYLSPTCGADAGTTQGPYSFQTFCNTITTGWSEDWSDFSGCRWNTYNLNGDGNSWILVAAGEYGISSYNVSANDYLMSPVFTCSDGVSDRLRFDARNVYYQYGAQYFDTLTIGVYDAGVTTLLGNLGTIIPETNNSTYEYDLSDYEGQDVRFFVYTGGGNNGISYIDNVVVDAIPSCDAPTELMLSSVTSSTAEIEWTSVGTESSWNVEYGPSGFIQGEGTVEISENNTYTISNLSAGTYDVYVQADCGGGELSDMIGPISVFIPCEVNSIYPYTVDFEASNSNLPDCFSEAGLSSDGIWSFGSSADASSSYWSVSEHTNIAYTNDDACNCDKSEDRLILQEQDFSAADVNPLLSFDVHNNGAYGGSGLIEISLDGGATWTIAYTISTNADWQDGLEYSLDYAGESSVMIALTYNDGGNWAAGLAVDNISISIPCEITNNIEETACDSYTWADGDGNTYTESGTYTITEISADGCDSIVNLTLIINESTSSLTSDNECDSYVWNGNTYDESGIYTYETTNIQNCPNIDSLDLYIDVSTSSFVQASSCESYEWNGITYIQTGEYTVANLENTAGCDSTATLELTINASNSSFQQASSCESYEWNGTTYSDIGTNSYTYNTVTVNGCDSIAELLLTINASTYSFEQASSCVSYNWNGVTYTESGLYTFESSNSAGCSNTDSLNLTITTVGTTSIITSCDSYDWNGVTYDNSGNYENDNGGCIDYLNLTINVSSSSFGQASSCGSYDWNGTTYSQSGTYTGPTTTNQVGCDSTSSLELTINEAVENNITETVCDELEWNGETYTESGSYSYQGTTTNGCDSTVNLTLTVNISTSSFDQASSCDTFVWNGETYSASGIYVVESTNNAGCPNVDSLNLTINNSTSDAISESACNSYEWDGSTYTVSGEYPYYSETISGCDSTVILSLTVNYTTDFSLTVTECSSYEFNGEILTLSGDYSDTIQSSTGCDSIINLSLTILGPDSIDVTVTECDADTYVWDGETYSASGSYTNSYQNVNGCDSIVTLDLTFNDPYAGAFLADFDDTRANFAAPTTLPGCWTLENTNLSTWTNSIGGLTVLGFNGFISGPSSGVNGEGDYLYVQTYNFDAGAYAPHNDSSIINTKEVDLSSLTAPELFFHYQLHGEHMGHLSVWINDASGSTEIFNKNGEMGNTWYEESIDLSDYSGTVSFSLLSILDTTGTGLTAASEMAVDNFEVREQPSCYDPYNLIVEGIDGSTATVSWLTNPSITSWNYVFGDPGVNPDSATVMTTTSSTLEIEDLAFASQYEMYVQSDCGTDWEGPLTINVPFPEDYGCTHTLNMIDDYGDGWNGGSIDVLINGATAISGGTVATGSEASIDFGAEDGDDITITNFVPGSWSGEISFNVTDGSGTVIYSSGEAGDLDASSVIDTTVTGGCPENDLVAIAAAVPSGCDLTEAETLEIWVYNAGVGAETGFTVSYSVNGGTEVTEDVTETLEAGDTLMYMFTTAADMSIAGEYDVTMSCSLSTDVLNTNDTVVAMGMNIASPEAPTTMGDTICSGEEGNLMAMSDSYIVWQDANGNVVGFGENLMVMDTVTASYYSEARAEMDIINDDFEDYTVGDLIAASSDEWEAWSGPNGGGADDAAVSSDQAADGSNSLYLNNADGDDIVLPLGDEAYDSGIITLEMDMFIVTTGYFNLQTQPTAGIGWAFSVFFDGGSVNVSEGATNTELSGTYPGANEWFNVALALDIDNGIGQLYIDGESQGTFEFNSTLGGVNIYANAGDEYYIDNVAASYVTSCGSELSEAVITINDCVGISELTNNNVSIYPNPSNGEFMVTNNVDINTISITDAQGKEVHSMNNLNLNKVNVDITNLEKGMYLINIETVNGTITKPVMVK